MEALYAFFFPLNETQLMKVSHHSKLLKLAFTIFLNFTKKKLLKSYGRFFLFQLKCSFRYEDFSNFYHFSLSFPRF